MTAPAQPAAIPDFVHTITTPTACAKNPNRWQAKDPWRVEQARRRCNTCPYQQPCQDWAMARPEEVGMWGGLTRYERQRARGEHVTDRGEHDEPRAHAQCPCGRFLSADAVGGFCHLHPGGVPILTPLLIATLQAALDGAPNAVVGERLGISRHAAISRLGLAYQRLGVNELPSGERRAAAIVAACAAGLLPGVPVTAATEAAGRAPEGQEGREAA